MGTAICRTCRLEKNESEFYKNPNTKRGLFLDCKKCHLAYKANYYYLHVKISQEYNKRHYKKNKETMNKASKEYYQQDKERWRAYHKERRDKFNERLHNYYKGTCQVCGLSEPFFEIYECHHLDSGSKNVGISTLTLLEKHWLTRVVPELEKCVYLCAICHRKLHAHRFDVDLASGKLVLVPGRVTK